MCVYVCMQSCTQSCLILCDPMDCTLQAPLSMGFHRQEYWSGLPFPSPGDLLDPEIKTGLRNCRWILYHLSHQDKIDLIPVLKVFSLSKEIVI